MMLKKIKDGIAVAAVVVALVVLWWVYLPWWGYFFLALAVLLGITELASRAITGMTISQQFWAFSKQHRKTAIALLASIAIAIALLLWHLGAKL